MAPASRNIVVVATPTSPVLSHLLHALSLRSGFTITIITRETAINVSPATEHSHGHKHENGHTNGHQHLSEITHIQSDFSESQLKTHLKDAETIICVFQGSDVHLQAPIIDVASSLPNIKLFIPSEFGLDTSNAKVRELLPPYQTRFEVQQKLRSTALKWTAIYSGLCLEDAMKTEGVFGIDALWGSVVVFPGAETMKVPISSNKHIAHQIVETVNDDTNESSEVWRAGFKANIDELVGVAEKETDRVFDRYEGILDGARKEAKER
ncbi:hypothetical protein LSUE1_G009279, partial [Lachnellula suecica]